MIPEILAKLMSLTWNKRNRQKITSHPDDVHNYDNDNVNIFTKKQVIKKCTNSFLHIIQKREELKENDRTKLLVMTLLVDRNIRFPTPNKRHSGYACLFVFFSTTQRGHYLLTNKWNAQSHILSIYSHTDTHTRLHCTHHLCHSI